MDQLPSGWRIRCSMPKYYTDFDTYRVTSKAELQRRRFLTWETVDFLESEDGWTWTAAGWRDAKLKLAATAREITA